MPPAKPATPPAKTAYEVVKAFWHDGGWRPVGEVLMLAAAEAKYLGDNVRPKLPAALQPRA